MHIISFDTIWLCIWSINCFTTIKTTEDNKTCDVGKNCKNKNFLTFSSDARCKSKSKTLSESSVDWQRHENQQTSLRGFLSQRSTFSFMASIKKLPFQIKNVTFRPDVLSTLDFEMEKQPSQFQVCYLQRVEKDKIKSFLFNSKKWTLKVKSWKHVVGIYELFRIFISATSFLWLSCQSDSSPVAQLFWNWFDWMSCGKKSEIQFTLKGFLMKWSLS